MKQCAKRTKIPIITPIETYTIVEKFPRIPSPKNRSKNNIKPKSIIKRAKLDSPKGSLKSSGSKRGSSGNKKHFFEELEEKYNNQKICNIHYFKQNWRNYFENLI